jgi:hypothetical protein
MGVATEVCSTLVDFGLTPKNLTWLQRPTKAKYSNLFPDNVRTNVFHNINYLNQNAWIKKIQVRNFL